MARSAGSLLMSIVISGLVAEAAWAQTLTEKEFSCMLKSTARAEAKFVSSKFKCISRCFYEFWHSGVMASDADCLPPYGGVTALCLEDVLKGAESKFSAVVLKACVQSTGADCPECYQGGDCTSEAGARIADVGAQVDAFVPGIFCERNDAMPQEQWCQRAVAKQLAWYVGAQHKCYAKCFTYAYKGLIPASACSPPGSDPTLVACLSKATLKSTLAMDKKCNDDEVPHSEPECGSTYPSGGDWTNLTGIWVGGNIPSRYCGD